MNDTYAVVGAEPQADQRTMPESLSGHGVFEATIETQINIKRRTEREESFMVNDAPPLLAIIQMVSKAGVKSFGEGEGVPRTIEGKRAASDLL